MAMLEKYRSIDLSVGTRLITSTAQFIERDSSLYKSCIEESRAINHILDAVMLFGELS